MERIVEVYGVYKYPLSSIFLLILFPAFFFLFSTAFVILEAQLSFTRISNFSLDPDHSNDADSSFQISYFRGKFAL